MMMEARIQKLTVECRRLERDPAVPFSPYEPVRFRVRIRELHGACEFSVDPREMSCVDWDERFAWLKRRYAMRLVECLLHAPDGQAV